MEKKILDQYNSPEGAAGYKKKFKKHWNERINNMHEQSLVRKLLDEAGPADGSRIALDMPCGYGRLYPLLHERGFRIVEGDWSFCLLQEAVRNQISSGAGACGHVRATALALPFKDASFDLVLSVRLCHHISSPDERVQYVQELFRVSKRDIIFTYFDTASIKNRIREFQRRFTDKRAKWTLSRRQVETLADAAGFEIIRSVPLSRFFSGHRYTMLRRRG